MSIAQRVRDLGPLTLVALSLFEFTPVRVFEAPAPATLARVGRVTPTAAMRVARMAHTATTLPDGRVLVAGGFTEEDHAAQSAEAYEPRRGQFAALPRLITLRHSHTATLLPNGLVLIAGGYASGNTPTSSAELFNPATNTFTPTGALRSARSGHVAVLLATGKVLIAGGVGPEWSFLSSAELYDPATGRFSSTGAMTVARESHAAARLPDGRVLIVGGHRGRHADITLYASAETYDVAAGVFKRAGDMRVRRHKHDAVALHDGRVLITGGSDERDNRGVYATTELFDPKSDTFSWGPTLARPRYKHNGSAVVLTNGQVLLAGGASQAETYDPRTSAFRLVTGDAQLTGQFSATAPLSGGRVLITGGYGADRGAQSAAWVYQP
jgi:hypothetical protein